MTMTMMTIDLKVVFARAVVHILHTYSSYCCHTYDSVLLVIVCRSRRALQMYATRIAETNDNQYITTHTIR